MKATRDLPARERAWLRQKSALAGGTTRALCRLVRLGILYEAVRGDLDEQERRQRRLRARGLSPAVVRRRNDAWLRTRASWRLRDLLQNLITWDRPGGEHFYGRAPEADPSQPWPRETAADLIAAGAAVFPEWP